MDWFVRSCILTSINVEKKVVNQGVKSTFLQEPLGNLIDISEWWPVQQKTRPDKKTKTKTNEEITVC